MNKKQFLNSLDESLQKLSSDERQDILQDFEEHFANGIAEGKSEEHISASLGSPNHIAKELLASYLLEKAEKTETTGNIIRAMWAVIGLGFFNVVIVLGPFIAIAALVFAGWASSIAFIASPLLVFMNVILNPDTFILFDLFFSMMLCGLGLFIAVGMFFITKALIRGFVHYLKFNTKMVKGGLKHV